MTAADDIIADLPLDQLADRLGTDPTTAEQAVRTALPALIGGMQANIAADDAGTQSLVEALGQHAGSGLLDGGIDLNAVDTNDGEAIVRHVFANSGDPAEILRAQSGGAGGDLIRKLLPILAPIVMAYLAKRLGMGRGQSGQASSGGGGLGDLLGPILGGLFGGGAASGGFGGGLGDILGQILGGQPPQAPTDESPAETAPEQGSPADQNSSPWQQPAPSGNGTFNAPQGGGDPSVRMPTAEEDPNAR